MAEAEQRSSAEKERDIATTLSQELTREKQELSRQKEEQRRSLYAAQMNLVQKAWDSSSISRVRELLNASRPQPGESDLRRFEWHYWKRMLHGEIRSVQLPIGDIEEPTVSNVALSAKTTGLFSQNLQSGIQVWSLSKAKLLFEKPNAVASLLSDNGSRIAYLVSDANTVRSKPSAAIVIDARTGKEIFRLSIPINRSVNGFDFSADGSRLAITGENDVFVYNVDVGKQLFVLQGHSGEILAVAFSADNARIASSAGNRLGTVFSQPISDIIGATGN